MEEAVDMITIRNEEERDYKVVEEITRKAFYISLDVRNIIWFTSCADMRILYQSWIL